MRRRIALSMAFLLVLVGSTGGCGFVSGQLRDKAMEEQLLKPGALDPAIGGGYETYSYKFLGRYRVSHDWLGSARPCHYNAIHSETATYRAARAIRDGDIYETDGHTYQEFFQPKYPERSSDPRYLSIDRYVRPEYTLKDGTKMKGFQSVCSEAWVSSAHVLAIGLFKMNPDDFLKPYQSKYPTISITTEQVGNNRWTVTRMHQLRPRVLNGAGGPFMNWLLPIGDTGYLFMFTLGANQQSLTYPDIHAKMQATFRHLIESVKIEPLQ